MPGIKLKRLREQVVVIAGASSGIGRETALRCARRGAKVVVSARSQAGLDSLVEEIKQNGGEATAIVADVSEFDQVQSLADRAVAAYGRIDTWVHAAAVGMYATFEQTTPEEFKRIIDVDLMGQVYGAMVALPVLKREGRGALIMISSVEAKRALPYHSAYAAAKHGIDGFLQALRLELRKEGAPISVTQVMPATINTPFFSKARTKLGVKPVGVPPIYHPRTVANVILYAAEHPSRDLIAGGAGMSMIATQRLSPRVMDAFLMRAGFRLQKTNEKKSENAPDNLYEPLEGDYRTEGDFSRWAFKRSTYNWLKTHPTIRRVALISAALGLAGVLNARSITRNNGAS